MDGKIPMDARMAPNQQFEYILKKYYHRHPPLPIQTYLSLIKEKPAAFRREIAQKCRCPEVIDALVKDSHPSVAEDAQKNEYWQLLGQYRCLLSLPTEEKIKFIRREGFQSLLVFLIFETDLKVREELYKHPAISLQMLNLLRHQLLNNRRHEEIEPHLQLIQSVVAMRRRRIFQVTAVFKEARLSDAHQSIHRIFQYILDDDEVVVRSAINVLKHYDYPLLREFIFQENPYNDDPINSEKIWMMLQRLQKYYRLSNKPLMEIKDSPLNVEFSQQNFLKDILTRKLQLLNFCSKNMNHTENLITLAHAHVDAQPETLQRVNSILNMEELLSLISDPTFPQAVSFKIMEVLKKHPSQYVHRRLAEIFLEIYERTRQRLREMELSISAYFDIIFSSLGNPEIQQIRQAFKVLDSAKKLTQGFLLKSSKPQRQAPDVLKFFDTIAQFYQKRLSEIYLDMAENRLEELEEVYELLLMIKDIPQDFLCKEGYFELENPSVYYRMLNSTRTIFRSTLGQFLGRLRDLDEMVQRKWIYSITDLKERQLLKHDMHQVMLQLDKNHKSQMKCKLTGACSDCQKRPCAAEHALNRVEFFLGELLDFAKQGEKAHLGRESNFREEAAAV
ncbi:MAG: hypothetical protein Kow0042_01190 [Calditrichia bacterium]